MSRTAAFERVHYMTMFFKEMVPDPLYDPLFDPLYELTNQNILIIVYFLGRHQYNHKIAKLLLISRYRHSKLNIWFFQVFRHVFLRASHDHNLKPKALKLLTYLILMLKMGNMTKRSCQNNTFLQILYIFAILHDFDDVTMTSKMPRKNSQLA